MSGHIEVPHPGVPQQLRTCRKIFLPVSHVFPYLHFESHLLQCRINRMISWAPRMVCIPDRDDPRDRSRSAKIRPPSDELGSRERKADGYW